MRSVVVNVRPDARAAGEYQLAFEAHGLMLPRPVRSFEAFGLDVHDAARRDRGDARRCVAGTVAGRSAWAVARSGRALAL